MLSSIWSIFDIWSTFTDVLFYVNLIVGLAGLPGNVLVLWHLSLRIPKGPLNVYLLHLTGADFLFLSCHVIFSLAARDLHSVITFLWLGSGLWLLAAFCVDCCLSFVLPCCSPGCRPPYASTVLCLMIWVLTVPCVLMPAKVCGLLPGGFRLFTCIRYHVASIVWLALLVTLSIGASVVLFYVANCSSGEGPKFSKVVHSLAIMLLFFRVPLLAHWSLRPILNFILPIFQPLALLLTCIDCSCRPLVYYSQGKQPGRREPISAILNRALGEGGQPSTGGLSLGKIFR